MPNETRVLLIIDLQHGFITVDTEHIVKPIRAVAATGVYDLVVATRFMNPPGSPFRSLLHWDGMTAPEDTALLPISSNPSPIVLYKTGYNGAAVVCNRLAGLNVSVDVVGVDTDACVLATALGLFDAGIDVGVFSNLCASTGGPAMHAAGLAVLERQLGKRRVMELRGSWPIDDSAFEASSRWHINTSDLGD